MKPPYGVSNLTYRDGDGELPIEYDDLANPGSGWGSGFHRAYVGDASGDGGITGSTTEGDYASRHDTSHMYEDYTL